MARDSAFDPENRLSEPLVERQVACALDGEKRLRLVGECEKLQPERKGNGEITRSVDDHERRRYALNELVALVSVVHQPAHGKHRQPRGRDVDDRGKGGIEDERTDFAPRCESYRDARAQRLANEHDALRRRCGERRAKSGLGVEAQPRFAGRPRRAAISAVLDRKQAKSCGGEGAKAMGAIVDPPAVAVEIDDERFFRRRRDEPGEQAFVVRRGQMAPFGLRQANGGGRVSAPLGK